MCIGLPGHPFYRPYSAEIIDASGAASEKAFYKVFFLTPDFLSEKNPGWLKVLVFSWQVCLRKDQKSSVNHIVLRALLFSSVIIFRQTISFRGDFQFEL